MKKIISVILSVALVMTLFAGTAFANQGNGSDQNKAKEFKDIKGHWGVESIMKMQSLGILNGYEDGTFKPDKALTQAELAVMIDRLVQKWLNIEEDKALTLEDNKDLKGVPDWAKKSVFKGAKNNYFNLKRFHSQVQCDRLMACVALAKALKLEPVTDYTVNPFKDRGLIANEDYGYILALYKAGFIKGYPDGNFNPKSILNRAQMACIIENLLNNDDTDSNDKTAPTWVTSSAVTASSIAIDSVELKWTAASDNVQVVGYKVSYKLNDVTKEKLVSLTRTTKIIGLDPNEEYTFTVEARDAAGNWSVNGPSVTATTASINPTVTLSKAKATGNFGNVGNINEMMTALFATTDSTVQGIAIKQVFSVNAGELTIKSDNVTEGLLQWIKTQWGGSSVPVAISFSNGTPKDMTVDTNWDNDYTVWVDLGALVDGTKDVDVEMTNGTEATVIYKVL